MILMPNVLHKLERGDRRSIAHSDEVAQEISADSELFSQVFEAMAGREPLLRMRAADAIEKVSRQNPTLLQPYKTRILREVAAIDQQEVRWHVAQILPRLRLTAREQRQAAAILFDYLEQKSSILKTFAMQALADFALHDPQLRRRVLPLLEFLSHTGTPAMRSRGRKLLANLAAVRKKKA